MLKQIIQSAARSFGYSVVNTKRLDRLLARSGTETTHSAPALPRREAEESLSAEYHYKLGRAARERADNEQAFKSFARANSLISRYEPAQKALLDMSNECIAHAARVEGLEKMTLLVKALEMNPLNKEVRRQIEQHLLDRQGGADLTQMCFVFYDSERARHIHEEAYKRALEFVTIGGIPGAVMEFGVLGGWSARILIEIMRDIFNLNNLYLFDSFEGLPEYESAIDRNSYEIAGRNVWSDKMKFPADLLKQFGQPHQWHIRDRLSEVIRPERILVRKGFYSDTLKDPPREKVSVAHIDCDLYQSTIEVLEGLHRGNCLQDGTVLLFDDWNCNKANPNYGERRALREFLERQRDFTATPWFTYGWAGAAYILHEAGA
ncbi:TylF/MycF/NovP-related O-methyltransferase [Bradyrhizobium sp. RT3a]|uniref:TylF/MycF/NovP-related O-methyltransferase n=1 Tax=unclassified Bradyrhizobium TaxID=2631580 RepID=UPI003391D6BF